MGGFKKKDACSVLLAFYFYFFTSEVLLFVWKLEAGETGVLLDVLLAHSFLLYSSSHSGGLASGAIWLSSTEEVSVSSHEILYLLGSS